MMPETGCAGPASFLYVLHLGNHTQVAGAEPTLERLSTRGAAEGDPDTVISVCISWGPVSDAQGMRDVLCLSELSGALKTQPGNQAKARLPRALLRVLCR